MARGRVLLSVLLAVGLGAGTARAADQATLGNQKEMTFEKEINGTPYKMGYLLYLPKGYGRPETFWPLLLFLHGAGETGTDLSKVAKHGPPRIIKEGKDFPFIVVSPQSPTKRWNVEALNALLDEVVAKYKVNKDRIYVTGLSMGGYGTWALGAAYPRRFAALAPICGGGLPEMAEALRGMPIWVFHGAKDKTVALRRSEEMVQALKAAGNTNVKFTVYPEAGHDSWTETYNNPELYRWLMDQKQR